MPSEEDNNSEPSVNSTNSNNSIRRQTTQPLISNYFPRTPNFESTNNNIADIVVSAVQSALRDFNLKLDSISSRLEQTDYIFI